MIDIDKGIGKKWHSRQGNNQSKKLEARDDEAYTNEGRDLSMKLSGRI